MEVVAETELKIQPDGANGYAGPAIDLRRQGKAEKQQQQAMALFVNPPGQGME